MELCGTFGKASDKGKRGTFISVTNCVEYYMGEHCASAGIFLKRCVDPHDTVQHTEEDVRVERILGGRQTSESCGCVYSFNC